MTSAAARPMASSSPSYTSAHATVCPDGGSYRHFSRFFGATSIQFGRLRHPYISSRASFRPAHETDCQRNSSYQIQVAGDKQQD